MEIELIGVPFDGYGRPGHQASAPGVLREAGLPFSFGSRQVTDSGDLDLPAPSPERGADTSLVNETALLAMTDEVGGRVAEAVTRGRFPIVFGGDCTCLLGIVPALRDVLGGIGLVFVDGHEDTMPLDVSEDGEAANTEIGLLLGLTGGLVSGPLRVLTTAASRKAQLIRAAGRFTMLVDRVAPTVRYVSVEGPVTRIVSGTRQDLQEITERYLPSDQVAGYMSMAEAEHGDQVTIHMRPERWLSADLG